MNGKRPARRRALGQTGGETEVRGDASFSHPLRVALDAAGDLGDELAIHAFHTYPARMHPAIARTVLDAFDPGGRRQVLDPFCGSGTVLVEAMRAGWRTLGSDLSPLAVALARLKSLRIRPGDGEHLRAVAAEVAVRSEERVRGRVDVRAKLSPEHRGWYDVHVLKELAGLLEEIRAVGHEDERAALEMVFSAIVVKFSKRRSETSNRETEVPKRIRKGLVTEFFVRKTNELTRAHEHLRDACIGRTFRPRIVRSDARRLPHTLSGRYQADLLLTSPPYGGTYDYADHHDLRMAWLGMKMTEMREHEIGARRRHSRAGSPVDAWDAEVLETLEANADLVRPKGVAVWLLGDGQVGGIRVPADQQLERLAPQAGFEVVGVASQAREDFAGGGPRKEHLVAMLRA